MNQRKTAEKYFKTRAKDLPFHECYINAKWNEKGMATVFISKKQPSGNYIYAIFLIDIYCLGVKNAMFNFNQNSIKYEDLKSKLFSSEDFVLYDIVETHNIIYGAIDYAEELGFKPHKDFNIAEYILNSDLIDDGIDEIEFGHNGKPLFVAGPDDNVNRIINTLKRTVGEGNFYYIIPEG
ncbi:MAG: hypothetical protein GXO79_06295 [Chlorobi bacterium]|nr:hypothetical protein [Chlorobiota bacterium]